MAYTLPSLPYPYEALQPHIDAETMRIHHTKHHQAYIDKLNAALKDQEALAALPVEDLLRRLAEVPDTIRTAVRNHGGGHANHTVFWQTMSPQRTTPQRDFADVLDQTFGSRESFREKFTAVALSVFGSGWAWLVLHDNKLDIVPRPNQDSPLMDMMVPLLGLDLWEHAYYLQYQNRRPEYVKAWWNVIHWSEVAARYAAGRNVP